MLDKPLLYVLFDRCNRSVHGDSILPIGLSTAQSFMMAVKQT